MTEGDSIRESVSGMVKHILLVRGTEIDDKHIRDCLNAMLWKYSEADGKKTPRFYTPDSVSCSTVQFEHPFQRKEMIDLLMKCSTETEIDEILGDCCGCTVTNAEHKRLGPGYGWIRYKRGSVPVTDRLTGESFQFPELSALAEKLRSHAG